MNSRPSILSHSPVASNTERITYDPIWEIVEKEIFPQVVANRNFYSLTPDLKKILGLTLPDPHMSTLVVHPVTDKCVPTTPSPTTPASPSSLNVMQSDILNDSRISSIGEMGLEFDMTITQLGNLNITDPKHGEIDEGGESDEMNDIDGLDDVKIYLKVGIFRSNNYLTQ